MARRYVRDKIGRFAAKGGGVGKSMKSGGPAAEFEGRRRMARASERASTAVTRPIEAGRMRRAEMLGRDIRAAREMQTLGVLNRSTGRYRQASVPAKAREVSAAKSARAQARLAQLTRGTGTSMVTRGERQIATRRGRNVAGLVRQRRYARPK